MNRAELVVALDLASEALAAEASEVKVFKDFGFTPKHILAYNDAIGVCLPNDTEFVGTVPGHTLLKFLKSCAAEKVEFKLQKDGRWLVKCGGSSYRFVADPIEEYSIAAPPKISENSYTLRVDEKFLNALKLCVGLVSERAREFWTAGVTLHLEDGLARMAATNKDRNSIHFVRWETDIKDFDTTIILSAKLCKTVLSFLKGKSFSAELTLTETVAAFHVEDEVAIWGKTIAPDPVVDLVDKATELWEGIGTMHPMPGEFAEALKRAEKVSTDGEATLLTCDEATIVAKTETRGGVVRDSFATAEEMEPFKVRVDARRLLAEIDNCEYFAVNDRMLCMCSAEDDNSVFVKLAANRT